MMVFAGHPAFGQSKKSTRSSRALQLQQRKYQELRNGFQEELNKLADWCDEYQLAPEAKLTRSLTLPVDTKLLVDIKLPSTRQAPIASDLPASQTEWQMNLRRIRTGYAKDLYRLSREVLRVGATSFAFDMVREVALHDPDHKQARAVLGSVSWFDPERRTDPDYHGEWVSPFAAKMMSPPQRHGWDDRFGWVLKSHIDKYRNGMRLWKKKWISADREAEIRRDFDNAWEVRTEHFLVKTNHSLERGVEVAKELEDYHGFFMRTFASFFETPEELEERFSNSSLRRPRVSAPYEVHYYATRDEYNGRLIERIPQIAMTNGMYYAHDETCFFYHYPDNENTLFHEATHQIFDLSTRQQQVAAARAKARKNRTKVTPWVVAERNNFWVIEGFACYMESFNNADGQITLGDPGFIRFKVAQQRIIDDGYYVPFREITPKGMVEFQVDPNIKKNYTQASGMAHFLMHYNNGAYRDALMEYLSQLYRPSTKDPNAAPSLANIIGVTYEELDEQYREHMRTPHKMMERPTVSRP